jgi:hypothetical protein
MRINLKFSTLNPRYHRYETKVEPRDHIVGDHATWRERGCPTQMVVGPVQYVCAVDSIDQAQGARFLCPKCFAQNRGPAGTHLVEVTFRDRGVADDQGVHGPSGKPVRWTWNGLGAEACTFDPSVLVVGGCGWHGHVRDGEVSSC